MAPWWAIQNLKQYPSDKLLTVSDNIPRFKALQSFLGTKLTIYLTLQIYKHMANVQTMQNYCKKMSILTIFIFIMKRKRCRQQKEALTGKYEKQAILKGSKMIQNISLGTRLTFH